MTQLPLWQAPSRDPKRDPRVGDSLSVQLATEDGDIRLHSIEVLGILDLRNGPRISVRLIDVAKNKAYTEHLTLVQWWEGQGFKVPPITLLRSGEGWMVYVERESFWVASVAELAVRLLP